MPTGGQSLQTENRLSALWMNKTMLAQVLCNPTNSLTSRKQQGNRVCKRILILFGFLKSRLAPHNKICIHQNSFAWYSACYWVGLVNRKPSHGWGLWRDHTERETHTYYNRESSSDHFAIALIKNHYNTEKCRQWMKTEELLEPLPTGQTQLDLVSRLVTAEGSRQTYWKAFAWKITESQSLSSAEKITLPAASSFKPNHLKFFIYIYMWTH